MTIAKGQCVSFTMQEERGKLQAYDIELPYDWISY
jgi:cold shock CspA family protein